MKFISIPPSTKLADNLNIHCMCHSESTLSIIQEMTSSSMSPLASTFPAWPPETPPGRGNNISPWSSQQQNGLDTVMDVTYTIKNMQTPPVAVLVPSHSSPSASHHRNSSGAGSPVDVNDRVNIPPVDIMTSLAANQLSPPKGTFPLPLPLPPAPAEIPQNEVLLPQQLISSKSSDSQATIQNQSTPDALPTTAEAAKQALNAAFHFQNPVNAQSHVPSNSTVVDSVPSGLGPNSIPIVQVFSPYSVSPLGAQPSHSNIQRPTCTDLAIRSLADARTIFHAVRLGILTKITRRLNAQERRLISSGSVYVWEEKDSGTEPNGTGLERWTDGRQWRRSRMRQGFLYYNDKHPTLAVGSPPLTKQSCTVLVDTAKGQRKWHLVAYFAEESVGDLKHVDDIPQLANIIVPHDEYRSVLNNMKLTSTSPTDNLPNQVDGPLNDALMEEKPPPKPPRVKDDGILGEGKSNGGHEPSRSKQRRIFDAVVIDERPPYLTGMASPERHVKQANLQGTINKPTSAIKTGPPRRGHKQDGRSKADRIVLRSEDEIIKFFRAKVAPVRFASSREWRAVERGILTNFEILKAQLQSRPPVISDRHEKPPTIAHPTSQPIERYVEGMVSAFGEDALSTIPQKEPKRVSKRRARYPYTSSENEETEVEPVSDFPTEEEVVEGDTTIDEATPMVAPDVVDDWIKPDGINGRGPLKRKPSSDPEDKDENIRKHPRMRDNVPGAKAQRPGVWKIDKDVILQWAAALEIVIKGKVRSTRKDLNDVRQMLDHIYNLKSALKLDEQSLTPEANLLKTRIRQLSEMTAEDIPFKDDEKLRQKARMISRSWV